MQITKFQGLFLSCQQTVSFCWPMLSPQNPFQYICAFILVYESVLYGSNKVFNVLDSGSVDTCRYCDGEVKFPIMFVFHSVVLYRHGWSLLLHPHPAGFTHWLRPLLEWILGGEDGGRQFSLLVCRYGDSVPMRPNIMDGNLMNNHPRRAVSSNSDGFIPYLKCI